MAGCKLRLLPATVPEHLPEPVADEAILTVTASTMHGPRASHPRHPPTLPAPSHPSAPAPTLANLLCSLQEPEISSCLGGKLLTMVSPQPKLFCRMFGVWEIAAQLLSWGNLVFPSRLEKPLVLSSLLPSHWRIIFSLTH